MNEESPCPAAGAVDWRALAQDAGVDEDRLVAAKDHLRSGVEALRRELRKPGRRQSRREPRLRDIGPPPPCQPAAAPRPGQSASVLSEAPETDMAEPSVFHLAFDRQMRMHRETPSSLSRALVADGYPIEPSTLRMWRRGIKAPAYRDSFSVLDRLENRWRLPRGYFRARLPCPSRAMKGQRPADIGDAERRRLAWHLPDDFERRSPCEREEILEWVRRVVVAGSTDYRRYQSAAMKHRFAIRFPDLQRPCPSTLSPAPWRATGPNAAPWALGEEMKQLVAFKTAALTTRGYRRRGVWSPVTAAQRTEHFGLMFGALAASPDGPVRGAGIPREHLTFALLVLPQIWDWYLRWREQRRGFFTAWEVDMLSLGLALTSPETGWLTQTPQLVGRLQTFPGLVTGSDIEAAKSDWAAACNELHRFALIRSKEVGRISRVHHDPFEPILPVLEASSPVSEYRKIADEVRAHRPCPRRYPKAAAESARAFLMIRFGLHLGFRQKNLRQLLVCPRGATARTERQLTDLARGELRWSDRDPGWEVFVPSRAFKNAGSSFFGGRPFRLILPDIAGLYAEIETYLASHRARLLAGADDPGTFFVKSVKRTSGSAEYDQNTFYEAWRWIIQRHGIFNPYTGRGAIPGLLPHGPHNVRDVLATHVLKQTGSYEQASYAIQDTPETVSQHYGRFLPQDKAAMAAEVLNRAWI